MPSITYARRDHVIQITSEGEAAEISNTPPNGGSVRTRVAREILDRAATGDDADLRKSLAAALSRLTKLTWPSTIERTLVEVGERGWSAIPFESFLRPDQWLVRSSPVRPR